MKIKTIIITGIVILLIFIIYLTTIDQKIYYLDLNVNEYPYQNNIKNYIATKKKLEKFVSGYTKTDDRTTDLINTIQINKKIEKYGKNQSIKNALIKADLVTITTGKNDLVYTLMKEDEKIYEEVDEVLRDINKLLKLVREYCKEDIIMIGLKNEYGKEYIELIQYINSKIGEICYDYQIYFINPMDYDDNSNIDWNVVNEIKKKIDTKILN